MVKVGLIGAGFMGSMHAAVYSQLPDVKLVGIADIRGDKAKSLAKRFKSIPYYDAQQLIDREDVNTVDICLPTYMHKEYVLKAARAKKDVFCEKPMALSVDDAQAMIDECSKNNVRFMVGHVIRFWNEYRLLKEACDSNKYGRLKLINCRRLSPLPGWSWENWILDPEKSGGAALDLHVHDTDFICYLAGQMPEKVYSKSAATERKYDHIVSTFSFPDGLVATAEGNWNLPANYPFEMSYIAEFEKAVMEFNSRNNPSLVIYERSGKIEKPEFQELRQSGGGQGNISELGGYFYELRYFVDHIRQSKPFKVLTPEQARDSVRTVLKEKESVDKKTEITI